LDGSVARGEALYKQTTIGAAHAPGCILCHSLEEGLTLVGPSHAGVATLANVVVPGVPAGEYLAQSIIDPEAFVAEGFPHDVMYQMYGRDLSDQEIADLVAFLLTLE
jgi:hypothetical protein